MTIYHTDYYVYAYMRKDGTPYYIGKGRRNRAFKKHNVVIPSDRYLVIVESNLTEIGALAIERRLIRWYGRKDNETGILRNLTDGGEGGSGYIVTKETKEKLSKKNSGKNNPFYGKKHTQETIEKNIAAHKGKIHTEETKRKMSESAKNFLSTKEARKKRAETTKKMWKNPEFREKITKRRLGVKRGPYKGRQEYSKQHHKTISSIQITPQEVEQP
jgi:hypothetical protein